MRNTTPIVAVALAFALLVSCSKAPEKNQAEQSASTSSETASTKEEQSDDSESASTKTSDNESESETSGNNESASTETTDNQSDSSTSSTSESSSTETSTSTSESSNSSESESDSTETGTSESESESATNSENETASSTSSEGGSDPSKTSSSDASSLPEFTVKTVDGNDLSHEDLLGKVTVINFWGTWCPPCVKEIPHFQKTYENLNEKGFTMLGIAVPQGGRGTADDVKSFMKKHNMTYPVVMYDTIPMDQFQMKYVQIKGLPTTLVLDQQGQLQKSFVGYTSKEKLNNAIEPLLDE